MLFLLFIEERQLHSFNMFYTFPKIKITLLSNVSLARKTHGLGLPLTKLRYFVSVSAGRYAAPLSPMVLRGVIEVERARRGVCASVEMVQIRSGQEVSDLACQDR